LVTEVGCLRCGLLLPYRAIPPHTGALLQQQQMQAPISIPSLMELLLSYSGAGESQFAEWFGDGTGPAPAVNQADSPEWQAGPNSRSPNHF